MCRVLEETMFCWDKHNEQLKQWVQTDEARQAFHNFDQEIQEATDG
jgi:hypothetical protein